MEHSRTLSPLYFLIFLCFLGFCYGSRNLFSLYKQPPMSLNYHNGPLLEGHLRISLLWYGKFTPAQKSIVIDFVTSLDQNSTRIGTIKAPTVSNWWRTVDAYMEKASKKKTHLVLSDQISDENYSMGKILKKTQVSELASRVNSKPGGLTLVLTAEDVAVEGFCMSNCGYHGRLDQAVFIWVGNSVTQCPGQCAWPFHQPVYGPQTKPLGSPNGDVGVDGMIVNIASIMVGTVTNPFGNGYYQGSAGAPMEAASACTGMYGKGAYPGYPGDFLVDLSTGGSYNALGVNGRKHLLPAIFNPNTEECSTVV